MCISDWSSDVCSSDLAGQHAVVVLDATPFYAESGGQVGDTGLLEGGGARFAVADTLKIQAGVFGHHGVLESGSLAVGDTLLAQIGRASCSERVCQYG